MANLDLAQIALMGTGLGGAVGATQLIGGAAALGNNRRPTYNIPPAMQEALNRAKLAAEQDSAGFALGMNQNAQLTQNQIQAAQTSSNMNAALALIQANANKQTLALTAQNDAFRQGQQGALLGQLGAMAEYQDQQYQLNEVAPYNDRRNLGEDLVGAGVTNLMGAAKGLDQNALAYQSLMSKSGGETSKLAMPTTPTEAPQGDLSVIQKGGGDSSMQAALLAYQKSPKTKADLERLMLIFKK